GCRVRHANHGSESAACRRRRAGGDGFLGGLARLAQMNVQVNQSGTDDTSADIHFFNVSRRFGGGVLADGGDFAVHDEQIGGSIEAVGGVNHPSTGEEQRIHVGGG